MSDTDRGSSPLVSVVIRSMDRLTLQEALDSVGAQTYPNIEVVLVDAKGAEHRDMGEHCGRFPLRMVGTGGPLLRSRAANLGLDAARGTYLIFLDDDDYFAATHIQSLVAALGNTGKYSRAAYAGVSVIDDQGHCIDTYNKPYSYKKLFGSNSFPIHAVMFHKSLLGDGCRFDENLEVFEDWDFWTQVAEHTDFIHVDQISGFYRAALGTSGISYGAGAEQIRLGREAIYEKWRTQWDGKKINLWVENLLDLVKQADEKGREIAKLLERIAGQDAEAVQRNAFIAQLTERVAEQGKEAGRRDEFIAQLTARLVEQDREATQRDEFIAQQAAYISEQDKLITHKEGRISGLELEKDALNSDLSRGNEQLANYQLRLHDVEKALAEKESEITAVCGSRSWKITRPLRWSGVMYRRGRNWLKQRLTTAKQSLLQARNDVFFAVRLDIPIAVASASDAPQLAYQPFSNELSQLLSLHHKQRPNIEKLDGEIDIIVPVYNGMEYLPRFFESLIRNTSSRYKLIVVDDCSPDARVLPLLQGMKQQIPNMQLLRNNENLGFVGTVNRAFKHTRNHFVLLNTDVEVPPFWLERLLRPLVRNPLVASVTPFTNAGTICSFPVICQDNELIDGLLVDQVDSVFAEMDAGIPVVEVPTGVGFCMAVNWHVAKKIGFFDAKTFGRGYAEENDWCVRAMQHGYHNIMVPNLFVYHKHGGSFSSEEKDRLVARNLNLLCTRYPFYSKLVAEFIEKDPVAGLRNFMLMMVSCKFAASQAILIFDHDIGGGANHYRNRLIEERLAKNQPVLLYSENLYAGESCKLRFFYGEFRAEFKLASRNDIEQLFQAMPLAEIFYNNAVSFNDAEEVPRLLKSLKQAHGAKLTISFHDFYPVCPSYTLLNDKKEFCRLPAIEACRNCLPNNYNEFPPVQVTIDEWRAAWGDALAVADELLYFSQSTLSLVNLVYQQDMKHVTLRPHELNYIPNKKPKLDFHGGLNIGVVGAINMQKGLELVLRMGELIQEQKLPVRIFVIGIISSTNYPDTITVTGAYKQIELPDIFEKLGINMGFLPSIWPETFSYVTSEMMAMELPICCFDLGAPAERVREYRLGRLIDHVDAEAALQAMNGFFDELRCSHPTP